MASAKNFLPKDFYDLMRNDSERLFSTLNNRNFDTEIISLEYFAREAGAVKGKVYSEVSTTLKITTDLCPCPSCSKAFQEFSEMFPNVIIEIETTTTLHYDID
jgi:hypothetical protein